MDKSKQPVTGSESAKQWAEKAAAEAAKQQALQASAPKIIGEHKVKPGETLTHITLKFYGEVDKPYWQYLYEFNKAVIGPDMKLMQPGITLKIPELPPNLQKKAKK